LVAHTPIFSYFFENTNFRKNSVTDLTMSIGGLRRVGEAKTQFFIKHYKIVEKKLVTNYIKTNISPDIFPYTSAGIAWPSPDTADMRD
jgi:hypothetical protein